MAGTALLSVRVLEISGRDGTFEMVYMSEFCPFAGPSNRRWRTVAGTVLLSVRMLETLATTAILLAAVAEALAGAVLFAALDVLDV